METYLFYYTHLIMVICAFILVYATWREDMQIALNRALQQLGNVLPVNNLKVIYRSLKNERPGYKALLITLLNIGLQITNQLLK